MRRFRYPLALVLALVGGGVARAGVGDEGFVDEATTDGLAEVKLSQLALTRAQSPDVRQFARKMVEDHSRANLQLAQIAEQKKMEVPARLDAGHQELYDRLARLEGAEFDRQYMRAMSKEHDDTVKLFEEQSKAGKDAELKQFAMKTLPVLEKHDDLAHRDEQKVSKASKELQPAK